MSTKTQPNFILLAPQCCNKSGTKANRSMLLRRSFSLLTAIVFATILLPCFVFADVSQESAIEIYKKALALEFSESGLVFKKNIKSKKDALSTVRTYYQHIAPDGFMYKLIDYIPMANKRRQSWGLSYQQARKMVFYQHDSDKNA